MRRYPAIIFVVTMALVLIFPHTGECRRKGNLYNRLSKKDVVKVYILEVTDSSGKATADLKALKEELETALVTRLTLNFKLVPKKEGADIIIGCDVKEFVWADSDPIDMVGGIGPLAWDLVNDDNYGRMQAVFIVMDGSGHKRLWEDKLRTMIRFVKVFMIKCVSKNH